MPFASFGLLLKICITFSPYLFVSYSTSLSPAFASIIDVDDARFFEPYNMPIKIPKNLPAFDMMKEIMGVRLTAIHSGDKVLEE